ncbi:type IV pilin protein [Iodobacter sp.]|uniref:type IV pilin protein n=1 Tax=Iodobacter sp. TaxID=1915058 RepID=UPI0025FC7348|nr:type IV pilin protein [Iodobacter sp.]
MSRGFTLIELVIALVIIAIIAAFALPYYQEMVRKSRRNDAVLMMAKIQLAEEKWRVNNNSYSNALSAMGFNLAGDAIKTKHGYYNILIKSPTATSYRITATAIKGSSQALDQGCTTLVMTISNKQTTHSPPACWPK